MYCRCGHESAVITPSHRGEGRAGEESAVSCARLHTKRSSYGRQHGNEDLENFTPDSVFVKKFHSSVDFKVSRMRREGENVL